MKQRMIMTYDIVQFEHDVKKWCEAGWTVVSDSQGVWQENRSTTTNPPRELLWVWMQEPAYLFAEEFTQDDLRSDLLP